MSVMRRTSSATLEFPEDNLLCCLSIYCLGGCLHRLVRFWRQSGPASCKTISVYYIPIVALFETHVNHQIMQLRVRVFQSL